MECLFGSFFFWTVKQCGVGGGQGENKEERNIV